MSSDPIDGIFLGGEFSKQLALVIAISEPENPLSISPEMSGNERRIEQLTEIGRGKPSHVNMDEAFRWRSVSLQMSRHELRTVLCIAAE
jgi:hypothetical protein